MLYTGKEGEATVQDGARPLTYQLHIVLEKTAVITIGRLGTFMFPAGNYIYTGSARRNIEARVARHLANSKKTRWHIDYLLADTSCRIDHVEIHSESECNVNQRTEGVILIRGFGSTDCTHGCGSHLKYIRSQIYGELGVRA